MKLLEKFKSRKFIAAIAGAAVGIALMLGVDESEIRAVVGAVTSACSLVTYILVEGKVDAAAVTKTAESACAAAEEIRRDD